MSKWKKILAQAAVIAAVVKSAKWISGNIQRKGVRMALLTLLLLAGYATSQYVIWQRIKQSLADTLTITTDGIATGETILASHLTTPFSEIIAIVNGGIASDNVKDNSLLTADVKDGTLLNADLSSSAGINFSKMESITASNMLLGNASGVPAQAPINGPDVTLGWSYATIRAITSSDLTDGTIVNADVNASAAIAGSKLQELSVGNNAGVVPSTGVANAHVASGAAIATTKMNFTAPTGSTLVLGSMWGFKYSTAPVPITLSSTLDWTDFTCDSVTHNFNDVIPSGPIIAIIWARLVGKTAHSVFWVRPNGTSWSTDEAPCLLARSDTDWGADSSYFLIATDSNHTFEYKYTEVSGNPTCYLSLLGYIGPIPK